ncbi:nuclear transport factor 2 family protein [Saxibacter everestensis]|uniref:Nuclear transport factor 2 family protein n=1 Tax=Saxibacter everestensis TaxID=2909229 RepID=A0ABY8QTR8_9MICO|nr:nuclear transport factor 2 family protein [Brevibacteriaceae bacterium ZFBP1038]
MNPPESELLAVAAGWAEAIIANDAERIAGFMAEEWVMVSDSGISSRVDFLALVSSGDLTHSAFAQQGEARIQVYGDTAIFTARVTNTAHYLGEQFDADEWTTDVFVRRDDSWLCVLSQITAAVIS